MLYRLNLLDRKSYEMLFEKEVIAISYKSVEDDERITRRENNSKVKIEDEISKFADLILGINYGDYIWINYKNKHSLAKVTDRTYFDKDRFLGLIKVEVFRYHGVLPREILENFEKITIEKIDEPELLVRTSKIFEALKSLDSEIFDISEEAEKEEEVVQLEFVKKENSLVEIKNNYGILPYKKPSKKSKRKDLEKGNFGELVIELYPPKAKALKEVRLPVISRSSAPVMKSGVDFYLEMIKSKLNYYSKQKEMEEARTFNTDRYIWGRFFEVLK